MATEIRKLSDTSKASTKEIGIILNSISNSAKKVQDNVTIGQNAVNTCNKYVSEVKVSFDEINKNAEKVLLHSYNIDEKSQLLVVLWKNTASEMDTIINNAESTASAVDNISKNILDLHNNIKEVAKGYEEMDGLAASLNGSLS